MKTESAGKLLLPIMMSLLLLMTSCDTVREDRQDCPCTLSVRLHGLPEYPAWLYVNGYPAGSAQSDTTLTVWVDKGPDVEVEVFSGAQPGEDGMVRVPYGSSSYSLYTFSGLVHCEGESGTVAVQMSRQFCTLSLELEGPGSWAHPFEAWIRGCVDGLDPWTGMPLPGDFHCRLDGDYRCRLPRQSPRDPLWLDITMADGVIRSFPLGEYLFQSSYDWGAPNLKDIQLQVNLTVSEIRLRMGLWERTVELEKAI